MYLPFPNGNYPYFGARWRIEVCCCCLKNSANRFASTLYHFLSSVGPMCIHEDCWRLNCAPSKDDVLKPPVPQNVTLFGNRVIADIVKMRSCWIRVNPSYSRTAVLTERRKSLWTGLCPPPRSIIHWSPNTLCDGIWRRVLWEMIRFRWGLEVGTSWQISTLIRESNSY